jgi:hypothetical protein
MSAYANVGKTILTSAPLEQEKTSLLSQNCQHWVKDDADDEYCKNPSLAFDRNT